MQGGRLQDSLDALQKSLGLSSDLEDTSGDVDVLGAIGDTYTELGDLEKAAEVRVFLCFMLLQASVSCRGEVSPSLHAAASSVQHPYLT